MSNYVHMDAIRRWIMDPNRQPNQVVANALEALLTTARTADTTSSGHTTEIAALQAADTVQDAAIDAAANDAGLALALAATPPRFSLDPHTFSWTGDATGSLTYDGSSDVSAVLTLLPEAVQDIVGAFVAAGAGIAVTYSDVGNTLTIAVSGLTSANISDFTEAAQDATGSLIAAGAGITATYNDAGNLLTISATGAGTGGGGGVDLFNHSFLGGL
jgi:hypothetical protein